MRKAARIWAVVMGLVVVGFAAKASADVVVLTFEGVGNFVPVGSFYDGAGGPDFNIIFSSNSLGLIDADAGGGGNFGHEPSPDTILFFLTGGASTMNVPSGFDTGFSFFYSAVNSPGSIRVWDGLDGTGTLLASLDLPVTPSDGGDPTGSFSPFFPVGVAFDGIAKSVDFAGTENQIGFDNITLGASIPGDGDGSGKPVVPEPASMLLFGLGTVGVGLVRRSRRKSVCA